MADRDDDLDDGLDPDAVDLGIAVDKVCTLIDYAKRLDAKVPPSGAGDESDVADADWTEVLEDLADDPILEEIREFVDALPEDEQAALVALVWVGRGTFDAEDWGDAVQQAIDEHSDHTADYLIGIPLLGTYLEDGLDAFGHSC